jgi:uncharacterized protein with beta-barrel porin domain
MRTPRHAKATDADLAKLREAHLILIDLATRLRPAGADYQALQRSMDAVRTTAIDWTGNPSVWSTGHGSLGSWDPRDPPPPPRG